MPYCLYYKSLFHRMPRMNFKLLCNYFSFIQGLFYSYYFAIYKNISLIILNKQRLTTLLKKYNEGHADIFPSRK